MTRKKLVEWAILAVFALIGVACIAFGALAHDIYGQLLNDRGGKCCSGEADTGDCAPALAKVEGATVAYLVHGKTWVRVPASRVRYEPIPGEEMQAHAPPPPGLAWGHFCGVPTEGHSTAGWQDSISDGWIVYCAYYPPGGA